MFEDVESRLGDVDDAGDWALNTAMELSADIYINPPGGRELFDVSKFQKNQIDLQFLLPKLREYPQPTKGFVGGLSIIDVMMFNGLDDTHKLVHEYETVSG
jgi:hypothetical protein